MKTVNVHDLKTNYSKYLDQVIDNGEEVILSKYGKPVAKIVPFPKNLRKPGTLKGKIWVAKDFDDTPQEWSEAMDEKIDAHTG